MSVCNKCCSVTGADTRAQRARGRRYDCRVLLCTSLPATRADTHVNRLLQPLWLRMARRTGLLQQVIVCPLHVLYNTATGTRTEWTGNIPELQLTQAAYVAASLFRTVHLPRSRRSLCFKKSCRLDPWNWVPCMHTCRASLTGTPPPPKPHIFLKIFIFVSIRRAGMVAKHDRMQAQSFFRSHVEFMKNASPVQPYHTLCTEQFFQEGKAKAEAASPATKALLLQSPSRPANIMKPFKCAVPSRLQLFFVVRSL